MLFAVIGFFSFPYHNLFILLQRKAEPEAGFIADWLQRFVRQHVVIIII